MSSLQDKDIKFYVTDSEPTDYALESGAIYAYPHDGDVELFIGQESGESGSTVVPTRITGVKHADSAANLDEAPRLSWAYEEGADGTELPQKIQLTVGGKESNTFRVPYAQHSYQVIQTRSEDYGNGRVWFGNSADSSLGELIVDDDFRYDPKHKVLTAVYFGGHATTAGKVSIDVPSYDMDYPLLLKPSTVDIDTATGAGTPLASDNIKCNPHTGVITATTFNGNATTATTAAKVDGAVASPDNGGNTAQRYVWFSRGGTDGAAKRSFSENFTFKLGGPESQPTLLQLKSNGGSTQLDLCRSGGSSYIVNSGAGQIGICGGQTSASEAHSVLFTGSSVHPGTSGGQDLGNGAFKWRTVYATYLEGTAQKLEIKNYATTDGAKLTWDSSTKTLTFSR